MAERSMLHSGPSRGGNGRRKHATFKRSGLLVAGTVWAALLALPTAVMARDVLVCQELKAAVADAQRGFATHKGALAAPDAPTLPFGKAYQAKKTMTGAKACSVVDVSLDEPKMRLRQTGYSCQFPAVFKLDKSLRAELTRCVAGEVEDPPEPDDFTIWVERVSSGEGYRATEVNALVNPVGGMTLWVRQSVCLNKGEGQVCEN